MHSSEKRRISLHSPKKKKKKELSEKQKQLEVLFQIEMIALSSKLNWLIFDLLWPKSKETAKTQTRSILRKSIFL